MDNQSGAARRQDGQRRRRHALAGSAAVAAAVSAAVIPASSASASIWPPDTKGVLYNFPTGLCVDVAGLPLVNYAMVRSWECNLTGVQTWWYDSGPQTLHLYYYPSWCLDVYDGGLTEGTPIDLYECNGTGAQKWIYLSSGALENPQSGLCLNIPGQNPNEGEQLWLWDCYPNPMQSWAWAYNE